MSLLGNSYLVDIKSMICIFLKYAKLTHYLTGIPNEATSGIGKLIICIKKLVFSLMVAQF